MGALQGERTIFSVCSTKAILSQAQTWDYFYSLKANPLELQ